MKLSPILITALIAFSVGHVMADTTDTTSKAASSVPATQPATQATPAAAPAKTSTDIVYPYTFSCTHCGMKITVKTPAEWKKSCEMCACGSSNKDCAPKKK